MPHGYAGYIRDFIDADPNAIIGQSLRGVQSSGGHDVVPQQNWAWRDTADFLRCQLSDDQFEDWFIVLEYEIPRRSRRPDVILLSATTVYVVEFKVGAERHDAAARWQTEAYSLDLRDFHAESQSRRIVPILCATGAPAINPPVDFCISDGVTGLVLSNGSDLTQWLRRSEQHAVNVASTPINPWTWLSSAYRPTLDIVAAAREIYAGNNVREISHKYAHNLDQTVDMLARAVQDARECGRRTICFVTGVPGAGKTLAGLEVVHDLRVSGSYETLPVFLSGNGPLVDVIRAAVARDSRDPDHATQHADRTVETLIQNVHNFLENSQQSLPPEHIVVFDEAQRAWDARKIDRSRKNKGLEPINASEPELLLDVMERVPDWAVVVALVGAGQEIYDGEAGLEEWGRSLKERRDTWRVVAAPEVLTGGDSVAGHRLFANEQPPELALLQEPLAHLNVVVRSHRAQKWAEWVNDFLELDLEQATRKFPASVEFPCFVTRELSSARSWLRQRHDVEPNERSGLVATSQDQRLRAYGIERSSAFRSGYDFVTWFLAGDEDIRSSVSLEVAASEFECQGLELDWVGLCWGGDLLPDAQQSKWEYRRFRGKDWQSVNHKIARRYTRNRYRVLLTRARKGLVIWVPPGDPRDSTRNPTGFDRVFDALRKAGVPLLEDDYQDDPAFLEESA